MPASSLPLDPAPLAGRGRSRRFYEYVFAACRLARANGGEVTPAREDARHLIWLRDQIGRGLAGGVVLHTGQAVVELDDRIAAVPLSATWTTTCGCLRR